MTKIIPALLALLALPLGAAPVSDLELLSRAEAVVLARVLSREAIVDERGDVRTRVELVVEDNLHGPLARFQGFRLSELGGRVGTRTLTVPDGADFAKGERALLFLTKLGTEWALVGRGHGKLSLIDGRTLESIDGRRRNATRFTDFIVRTLRGAMVPMSYWERPRLQVQADLVPGRYVKKGTRLSGEGETGFALRWQSFSGGLVFRPRGSQPDAPNGGLDALNAAVNAWVSDTNSALLASVGAAATTTTPASDSERTVQFNDPDGVIPGTYVKPDFTPTTGTLGAVGRTQHVAASFGGGAANRVVVAGGLVNGTVSNSAVLFNPATQLFAATNNTMSAARKDFQAIIIDDLSVNPLFLIAGGSGASAPLNSLEYYDTLNNSFSLISGTTLTTARSQYAAASLGAPSGRVLFTGGYNGTASLNTAEIFDPSDSSIISKTMIAYRRQHTAVALSGGTTRVLVAGGLNQTGSAPLSSAEIFDSSDDSFTATTTSMTMARSQHTATLLTGGTVLIAGGIGPDGPTATAEIFDPTTGEFFDVGNMSEARFGHTATRLTNGRVLITGGQSNSTPYTSADIYDTDTKVFTRLTVSMGAQRSLHTGTLLADGKVLLAGGTTATASTNTADLFTSPESFNMGLVKIWSDNTTYTFAGSTFERIVDTDIILQNGFGPTAFSGGGFNQLMANLIGQAFGLDTTFEAAVLNASFDIDSTVPYGSNLQTYDREAAGYVYPACPAVPSSPAPQTIRTGQTATLTVNATGGGLLIYQWFEEAGVTDTMVGTNSSSFTTPALTTSKTYYVRITNDCGTADSNPATITVAPRGDTDGNTTVAGPDIHGLADFHYGTGPASIGDPDVNNDSLTQPFDLFYLINYVHGGGPTPAP